MLMVLVVKIIQMFLFLFPKNKELFHIKEGHFSKYFKNHDYSFNDLHCLPTSTVIIKKIYYNIEFN